MNISKEIKRRNQYYKTIGSKSIYDIIKRTDWSLDVKISYIRHHYTFYNDHIDMFHDENGFKNKNSSILNDIIRGIVLQKWDASILSDVNKSMIEWRKSHPIVNKEEELLNDIDYDLLNLNYSNPVNTEEIKNEAKKLKRNEKKKKKKQELSIKIQEFLEKYPYYKDYFSSMYIYTLVKHNKNNNIVPISKEHLEKVKQKCIEMKGFFFPMNKDLYNNLDKEVKIQEKFIKGYNKLYKNKSAE